MQMQPHYLNVVAEVCEFLRERIAAAESAGIQRNRIVIDPGFGFGKTLQHNLTLFRGLGAFRRLGLPLLVGVSRKSMIGALLNKPVQQRLYGSLAAALLAAQVGVAVLRVHDVAATVDALRVAQALGGLSGEWAKGDPAATA